MKIFIDFSGTLVVELVYNYNMKDNKVNIRVNHFPLY